MQIPHAVSCCEFSSASADLPNVIKIVKREENSHAFLPTLDPCSAATS